MLSLPSKLFAGNVWIQSKYFKLLLLVFLESMPAFLDLSTSGDEEEISLSLLELINGLRPVKMNVIINSLYLSWLGEQEVSACRSFLP